MTIQLFKMYFPLFFPICVFEIYKGQSLTYIKPYSWAGLPQQEAHIKQYEGFKVAKGCEDA